MRLGRLLTLIHRHGIDVVYSNTVTVVDGAIAAKILRKPHIWHLHENIDTTKGLLRILPARYVAASLTLRLSALIAVPSHALKNQIFGHQLALPKVKVIYNGVDTSRFRPGPPSFFIHQQFGIPIDAPLVGICGAIQEPKGHIDFIKAAAEVSRTLPNAHFVVIGEGLPEYLNHLAQFARGLGITGKMHYTGWRSDISEIFRELQVVVIASRQEAFGLTAIEGMATGIPVVSTRCGGPEEVIADGETGYLVELNAHSDIAKKVLSLILNPVERQRMGQAGRVIATNNLSDKIFQMRVEENILIVDLIEAV